MAHTPADFADRGPHPVGVTTLRVQDPADPAHQFDTDVWYPAAREARGDEPPAQHPLNRPHAAVADLPPAGGPFPLVAFSHGNSGLRRQSTFFTTHLASWGIAVGAPDHPGNTIFEMMALKADDDRKRRHLDVRARRPGELQLAIETLAAGGRGWPALDRDRIGVLGHSFGGWTAAKLPGRGVPVRAMCGLAPASEPFVGRKAFEPGELPFSSPLPTLIVAGIDDVLVDLETSVRPLFQRLAAPRALLGVEATDHFHFCDGVELLHRMHESNPRPAQPRPTKPYEDQLDEERIHRIVRAVVTCFFHAALVEQDPDPCSRLDAERSAALDPALRRLDDRS